MAERAVIQIEVEAGDARAEISQTEDALSGLEVEAVEAGDGFERLSSSASRELAETRAQAERTAASMRQMDGAASGTATSLQYELVQGAQDAKFGMAGLANQIPLIQEQFLRLRQDTGSTTGALSSLASTFMNPTTGVVAGITLLLTFKDDLLSFFDATGDSAENTASKIKNIAEAASDVVDVTSGQTQDLELSLGQVDGALETTEGRIKSLENQIDALERLQGLVSPIEEGRQAERTEVGEEQALGEEQRTVEEIIVQTRERFDLENATQEEIQSRVDDLQEELNTEKGVRQNLENQQQTLQEQLRAQERLGELGAQKAENSNESADATEREAEAMNALAVSAKEVAENRQAVNRFFAQGGRRERLFGQFNFGRTPTVGGTMLNQGQSQGALMLQSARQVGIISQFQDFPELLKRIQQKTEDAGNEVRDSFQDPLATGIQLAAQLGTTLDQAFEKGINSAEEFAETVLPLIGQVIGFIAGGPQGAAIGGNVGQIAALPFAEGGPVRGEGGTTEDRIPALLSDREFVMRAASAQKAPELLQAMNNDPAVAQALEEMLTGMAHAGQDQGQQATIAEQTAALGPLRVENTKLAQDGEMRGKERTKSDQASAMLSDQEAAVQAASAQMPPRILQAINEKPAVAGMVKQLITSQDVEQFAAGGMVGASPVLSVMAEGGGLGLAKVPPPELMMNGEERTIERTETKEVLQRAGGASSSDAVIRKLDEVARRVETMDVRIDAFAANAELGRSQSQLERAGDTVYPQKG
jgi:hypothetical protein